MKYLVLLVLALSPPTWKLLTWVHDRNTAVVAGTAAYKRGDAARAATAFEAALTAKARRAPDPRLVLNLAHAQTRAGLPGQAQATYARLLTGTTAELGSVARQQLAVQAAQQGEIAQALTLLRQALLLDPKNSGARFDYEVLSDYLTQRPNMPKIPEPKPQPGTSKPKPSPESEKDGPEKNQPAEKAGTDRKGQVNDQNAAPPAPNTPPEQRPDPAGQADNRQPNRAPGKAATGGRAPGTGAPQPVASGEAPGTQRGLDRSAASPTLPPTPAAAAPAPMPPRPPTCACKPSASGSKP
ncbi:hypothetical protein ACFQT0_14990 [Hymenobacter humi]|uniref:Tetratricopeptide repeat protein n=1 Tax=Hymenobacter humi TaxID=1411620 RepID=A0ABW2U8V2_9BACT